MLYEKQSLPKIKNNQSIDICAGTRYESRLRKANAMAKWIIMYTFFKEGSKSSFAAREKVEAIRCYP